MRLLYIFLLTTCWSTQNAVEAFFGHHFGTLTENTFASRHGLRRHLQLIRRLGYGHHLFNPGALVTILAVNDDDAVHYPELNGQIRDWALLRHFVRSHMLPGIHMRRYLISESTGNRLRDLNNNTVRIELGSGDGLVVNGGEHLYKGNRRMGSGRRVILHFVRRVRPILSQSTEMDGPTEIEASSTVAQSVAHENTTFRSTFNDSRGWGSRKLILFPSMKTNLSFADEHPMHSSKENSIDRKKTDENAEEEEDEELRNSPASISNRTSEGATIFKRGASLARSKRCFFGLRNSSSTGSSTTPVSNQTTSTSSPPSTESLSASSTTQKDESRKRRDKDSGGDKTEGGVLSGLVSSVVGTVTNMGQSVADQLKPVKDLNPIHLVVAAPPPSDVLERANLNETINATSLTKNESDSSNVSHPVHKRSPEPVDPTAPLIRGVAGTLGTGKSLLGGLDPTGQITKILPGATDRRNKRNVVADPIQGAIYVIINVLSRLAAIVVERLTLFLTATSEPLNNNATDTESQKSNWSIQSDEEEDDEGQSKPKLTQVDEFVFLNTPTPSPPPDTLLLVRKKNSSEAVKSSVQKQGKQIIDDPSSGGNGNGGGAAILRRRTRDTANSKEAKKDGGAVEVLATVAGLIPSFTQAVMRLLNGGTVKEFYGVLTALLLSVVG